MKIRGIHLRILAESEFCPIIRVLAKMWEKEHGRKDLIEASLENRIAFMLLCMALGLAILTSLAAVVVPFGVLLFSVFVVGITTSTLATVISVVFCGDALFVIISFTRDVNRLDYLLREVCAHKGGIVSIPIADRDIYFFFQSCLRELIYDVVSAEQNYSGTGVEEEMIKRRRDNYAEFARVAAKFGVNLGTHGPYFVAATERLAKEKVGQAEQTPHTASEEITAAKGADEFPNGFGSEM